MKFFDRRAIEDTSPRVFIGRRIFINRSGAEQVAAHWYAEANYRGRTHVAPLKTASLSVAIHRAHQFADKLRAAGDAAPMRQAMDIAELARLYMAMQANRNRAPKTLAAYEFVLACFLGWTKHRFAGSAEAFTEQLFWEWHRSLLDDGYAPKSEIQAAVALPTVGSKPSITAPGLPRRRIELILNAIGGLPLLDLGSFSMSVSALLPGDSTFRGWLSLPLAIALISSCLRRAVPRDGLFLGEVDLNRALRPLPSGLMDSLAAKLIEPGFMDRLRLVVPSSAVEALSLNPTVGVIGCDTLDQVVYAMWPEIHRHGGQMNWKTFCDQTVSFPDALRWVEPLLKAKKDDVIEQALAVEPAVLGVAADIARRTCERLEKYGVSEQHREYIFTQCTLAGAISIELMRKGNAELWNDFIEPNNEKSEGATNE